MAGKLVDHLQMVGHIKCIAGQCIKSFEAKRGVHPPPPTGLIQGTIVCLERPSTAANRLLSVKCKEC